MMLHNNYRKNNIYATLLAIIIVVGVAVQSSPAEATHVTRTGLGQTVNNLWSGTCSMVSYCWNNTRQGVGYARDYVRDIVAETWNKGPMAGSRRAIEGVSYGAYWLDDKMEGFATWLTGRSVSDYRERAVRSNWSRRMYDNFAMVPIVRLIPHAPLSFDSISRIAGPDLLATAGIRLVNRFRHLTRVQAWGLIIVSREFIYQIGSATEEDTLADVFQRVGIHASFLLIEEILRKSQIRYDRSIRRDSPFIELPHEIEDFVHYTELQHEMPLRTPSNTRDKYLADTIVELIDSPSLRVTEVHTIYPGKYKKVEFLAKYHWEVWLFSDSKREEKKRTHFYMSDAIKRQAKLAFDSESFPTPKFIVRESITNLDTLRVIQSFEKQSGWLSEDDVIRFLDETVNGRSSKRVFEWLKVRPTGIYMDDDSAIIRIVPKEEM